MSEVCNVLFLCTGNSARSILAEALLNRMGEGRFHAFSAGSQPKGEPHPMALDVLESHGFLIDGMRSKSWTEFAGPAAIEIDLIITVCDNAAGESCPVWPGRPITAHWGIEDPAAIEGERQREAFERAMHYLHNRISLLVALPMTSIDELTLKSRLREIGLSEGATLVAKGS
ncbi:arsenate reductase ArsC [Altererythrobacter sp. Root672]|uniref:arsenate reductase ArsC n=1 Tax=Altererythrobacter sp. Root672 TaxID=1736584 RepID=UPI0006F6D682|nr:arsenate reductase ArsC [Altererythrobacter sp. Root672]KRA81240.1 ArsR family transcriptional regulator [Altererythrobacter sp. Root672]